MPVPTYEDFMLPLLKLAGDGREYRTAEAGGILAEQMHIAPTDRDLMLPSGKQTRLNNRVGWAVTYLAKSQLLEKTRRGHFRITPRGAEVLQESPTRIDTDYLERFPEYIAFKNKRNAEMPVNSGGHAEASAEATPEERLAGASDELRTALADDLQARIRAGTPKFFEHLVVRLLIAMGYGGGQLERGEVTGRSGDDGIDGVIREDRLGLDMVYVQAKKWDSAVGPGEIDKFVGSLMRKRAHKGVFITSGEFTDGASRAAREAAVKVRLINGDELAELMIDFDVGVSIAERYVVKKIDSDFFEESE